MNHGPTYKMVRRFTIKTMKDFGVGKLSLENSILVCTQNREYIIYNIYFVKVTSTEINYNGF